jgi:hypothetical protein
MTSPRQRTDSHYSCGLTSVNVFWPIELDRPGPELIRRFETAKIVTFNNISVQRSSYSARSPLGEMTTAERAEFRHI